MRDLSDHVDDCAGGRNWVRTSDPSLVRRHRTVAGRRPASPEVPASWTCRRQTSPYIAWRLPPLAPRLAPRNSVSVANGWRACADDRSIDPGPMRQIVMLTERHRSDVVFLPDVNHLDAGLRVPHPGV